MSDYDSDDDPLYEPPQKNVPTKPRPIRPKFETIEEQQEYDRSLARNRKRKQRGNVDSLLVEEVDEEGKPVPKKPKELTRFQIGKIRKAEKAKILGEFNPYMECALQYNHNLIVPEERLMLLWAEYDPEGKSRYHRVRDLCIFGGLHSVCPSEEIWEAFMYFQPVNYLVAQHYRELVEFEGEDFMRTSNLTDEQIHEFLDFGLNYYYIVRSVSARFPPQTFTPEDKQALLESYLENNVVQLEYVDMGDNPDDPEEPGEYTEALIPFEEEDIIEEEVIEEYVTVDVKQEML